jgi:hypothetical protein
MAKDNIFLPVCCRQSKDIQFLILRLRVFKNVCKIIYVLNCKLDTEVEENEHIHIRET